MRPIKIEFQAFGPYVGKETVDFEAISEKGLFLICGKTGYGKTVILDAMTFALYGKSSGNGRDDFEAMRCTNADPDTSTYVSFEFEADSKYYKFERRLEKKRKNYAASYNISKMDETGNWQPMLENAKDKALTEKATELIGLDYKQFRQVIILPQGQFEKLLTSNSEDKEQILGSIFGEEKWQKIADKFYEKAERCKSELRAVRDRINNSLAEEECNSINELELLLESKKASEKELDEKYNETDYDKLAKQQQEILSLAKRFGDLHKAEEKVNELSLKKEKRNGWEKSAKDAKRAEKVRSLIEDCRKNEALYDQRKLEEADAEKNKELKRKASEMAANELKKLTEKESSVEEYKKTKILYEGKRNDYDGLDELEKELEIKNTEAEASKRNEDEAKKQLTEYEQA
ncbi:MAG: AAA family ATPase, partial [Lachnospiraceae bacterium]|nr:AAA family ATPase [Lachnospiraceae bacterium]